MTTIMYRRRYPRTGKNNSNHNRFDANTGNHPPLALAEATGPLDSLSHRRIAVYADLENLRIGAKRLGCDISLDLLGERLRRVSKSSVFHGFFSENPFASKGVNTAPDTELWKLHSTPITLTKTRTGGTRNSNVDEFMKWQCASRFLARCEKDRIIIFGSGDGDLVEWLTRAAAPRTVMTLSLPGSTAHFLNADIHPTIAANITLGHDCLIPRQ